MISFKNGVLYGNGNILDYDRVGDKLVVNKEQAENVKRIFELYLSGNGVRKIQDIMEQEGRKTATGLTRWQFGNINRVLRNPFFVAESYTVSSTFRIIWFRRKSVIIGQLIRYM